MDTVNGVLDRARVVLTSVVTITTAIAVGITTIVIPAVSDALGADSTWVQYLGQVATVLYALVEVIRRVTPVPADKRGVLPKES